MEILCPQCGRFIGKEVQGRLLDRRGNILADNEISGYCIGCQKFNVWRSSGLISQEEADKPAARVVEWTPEINTQVVEPTSIVDVPSKPIKPIINPESPKLPVFVTFGNSRVYHSRNHFEDKVVDAKVITDTTGYRLCKICDGFVEGKNE